MTYSFLAILIILMGGLAALLAGRSYFLAKLSGTVLTTVGCLLGLIDSVRHLFAGQFSIISVDFQHNFALMFRLDALSAFFLVAIFAVSALAALYSFHYLDEPQRAVRTAVHYLFFSLLIASMVLVVTADNMLTFMLCWEMMSLSSFFLVIFDFEDKQNRRAGYLYLVFSHIGAVFILGAFGVMYAVTGDMAFVKASGLAASTQIVIFCLAFIGFGSKAGVFPFHIWLPHAHPAAPSHISAVMSGVMIKTGIYGLLRLYTLLDWHAPVFGHIVLTAGMISGILGVVYALGQHDLKRLLAYHSVENIGIILIGLGIGMIGVAAHQPIMAVLGFAGGLLHVLNHGIFKSLLFFGAGMVLHKTGTRAIDVLGGLIRKMRITGTTFLFGSLAISGLPPFNGFVSEFLIYLGGFKGAALGKTDFVLSLLAIISLALIGGLALACFSKVVGVVFLGEPRSEAARQAREHGACMLIPMVILTAACLVIGVLPALFVRMSLQAVTALGLGYAGVPLAPFLEIGYNITRCAAVFFILLAAILALRHLFYKGKTVTRHGTWGCGFTQPTARMQYTGSSYAASILQFFRPVAPLSEKHKAIEGCFPSETHYHSHVHDIAEKHLDKAIVTPVTFLFDRLRWLQHGDIHLYIGYILLAIAVLLFFVEQ